MLSENSRLRLQQQISVVGEKINEVLATSQQRINEEEEGIRVVHCFKELIDRVENTQKDTMAEIPTTPVPTDKNNIKGMLQSLKVAFSFDLFLCYSKLCIRQTTR